jgi:hypothetical protein
VLLTFPRFFPVDHLNGANPVRSGRHRRVSAGSVRHPISKKSATFREIDVLVAS